MGASQDMGAGGGQLPPKILENHGIRANARKNQENSGRLTKKISSNFITILHKIGANIQLPPPHRKASAQYGYDYNY
jgi:hypothetical protein